MPMATFAVPSFHGGEISKSAQGRFDKPDYRISLKACLNSFPNEIGTWVRRPGTRYAGHTRGGQTAKIIKFDYAQANAVTLEFTDSKLRARQGADLVFSNDVRAIVAISTANPAVVQTDAAHNWSTGNTVIFSDLVSAPLLHRRQFTITVVDPTHFSLQDALTGANIDGATLNYVADNRTVLRVYELTTQFTAGQLQAIRAVQAETTDILLHGAVAPQTLIVTRQPVGAVQPEFSLGSAVLNDGPYLDPFTNGVQATPGSKTGIVTITLSFPAYDATKAYKVGDFVTSAGTNYISLVDQNVGSVPPSANWAASSASAAINSGRGFLGSDIGRLVRLFSEPAPWNAATAYAASTAAAPVVVGYNATGLPNGTLYYQAAAASTGKIPGTDLTNWTLIPSGAAIWTWGRITSLSNIIDRALAGSASIGDMTAGGGLAAAFDGVFVQAAAASAEKSTSGSASIENQPISLTSYVGKNYSAASDQIIMQATVYPSSNGAFATGSNVVISTVTFNLRGKASLPASSSDGALLGTSGPIANSFSAVTIVSTDQTTAWKYVWIEMVVAAVAVGRTSYTLINVVAELSLFNPPGTGIGTGINVQLLGPALLYTQPITTWRLGAYSSTTGWPTCGTYAEGRLWIGGAIPNRFDACVSNGIDGLNINFAPTDQYGAVAANNAISYTLNSDSTNVMYWMQGEEKGITIGTKAGEWLVVAPTNGPLAPNNIAARRVTKHGSANINPMRTEHTLVFVKRYARKLLEFFSDANFGKFSAPNLADKAEHLVSSGIAEIAYTEAVTPILWGRDTLGALFGVTYKRDTLTTSAPPTFSGWHRHALGTSRTLESMCTGPSVGGDLDTLTMVTTDAATGIRHVELLTDVPGQNAAIGSNWLLDDAVAPTTTSAATVTADRPYGGLVINGLWHLNGQTVQVFAGGLDCGDVGDNSTTFRDFVVANGSITVPYGDSVSAGSGRGMFTADFAASGIHIVIGLTYTSDGQQVRPMAQADSGARNGPAFGKLSRSHRYSVSLVNTALGAIKFGGDLTKTMYPALFKNARGDTLKDPTVAYTGIHQDVLQDDYDYDQGLAWRVTRPLPANIAATAANLATQDQ